MLELIEFKFICTFVIIIIIIIVKFNMSMEKYT